MSVNKYDPCNCFSKILWILGLGEAEKLSDDFPERMLIWSSEVIAYELKDVRRVWSLCVAISF
jgi:hypothetical protein